MVKANRKPGAVVLWIGVLAVLVAAPARAQEAEAIVEVSGRVTDESGQPVDGAVVRAVETDVSAVLTDARGMYKFYLVGQKRPFILAISKDRHRSELSRPITPMRNARIDAVLNSVDKVEVTMARFEAGSRITGRATGLAEAEVSRYKVLVYIQTDQWYIHPFAENRDGRGYASITNDGSWTMQTVNRRHSPFRLAMLVVPMNYVPPSAVTAGADPVASLEGKFGTQLRACRVIAAPDGL